MKGDSKYEKQLVAEGRIHAMPYGPCRPGPRKHFYGTDDGEECPRCERRYGPWEKDPRNPKNRKPKLNWYPGGMTWGRWEFGFERPRGTKTRKEQE